MNQKIWVWVNNCTIFCFEFGTPHVSFMTEFSKLVSTLPKQPVSSEKIISQNSYLVSGRNEFFSFQQIFLVFCCSDQKAQLSPKHYPSRETRTFPWLEDRWKGMRKRKWALVLNGAPERPGYFFSSMSFLNSWFSRNILYRNPVPSIKYSTNVCRNERWGIMVHRYGTSKHVLMCNTLSNNFYINWIV